MVGALSQMPSCFKKPAFAKLNIGCQPFPDLFPFQETKGVNKVPNPLGINAQGISGFNLVGANSKRWLLALN